MHAQVERIRAGPAAGGKAPEQMSPQEMYAVLWQVLKFRDSGAWPRCRCVCTRADGWTPQSSSQSRAQSVSGAARRMHARTAGAEVGVGREDSRARSID
jgi:hypothetical protein